MLGSLRHRFVHSRATAWVLVALAVRSLVPDGFMVGTAAGGGPTVIFCHGAGMAMPMPAAGAVDGTVTEHHDHAQHVAHDQAAGAPDGTPAGPGQHHAQQGQCAFAASAVLAPPPYVAPPALGLVGPEVPVLSVAFELPLERARRPGARAPPALS